MGPGIDALSVTLENELRLNLQASIIAANADNEARGSVLAVHHIRRHASQSWVLGTKKMEKLIK